MNNISRVGQDDRKRP